MPIPSPAPGRMSLTTTVPAAVPSVFHSSRPVPAVVAEKKATPPARVSWYGVLDEDPGTMSSTWVVPPRVPSVRHSSSPFAPKPRKRSVPPSGTGGLSRATGAPSDWVPAVVPSLVQGPSEGPAKPIFVPSGVSQWGEPLDGELGL